jgi:type IV secretory pathway VirB10-like protein
MSSETPLQLGGPRCSVVRLDRRVISVVGAVLILPFVAELSAIHGQGKRRTDPGAERRTAPAPRSEPWFQGIPDQTPTPRPVGPGTASSPASQTYPLANMLRRQRLARAAKAPTGDEDQAQGQRRVLRAAMGAPIRVRALEWSGSDRATRRRAGQENVVGTPARVVLPTNRAQTPGTPPSVTLSMPSSPTRQDATMGALPPEYLRASVRKPVSPYDVKAGVIIPAVRLIAINSALPGQITSQVREKVYASDCGEHLLIPQGTRSQSVLLMPRRFRVVGLRGYADATLIHQLRSWAITLISSATSEKS